MQAGALLCACKMAEVHAFLRANIVHLLLLPPACLGVLSVKGQGSTGVYRTRARPFRRFAFWDTQTLTHKQDKIRMKSPRHPVMQAAEPFSDPAGTHCAGATDGANVCDDASLHHRAVWSTNGPLWLGDK